MCPGAGFVRVPKSYGGFNDYNLSTNNSASNVHRVGSGFKVSFPMSTLGRCGECVYPKAQFIFLCRIYCWGCDVAVYPTPDHTAQPDVHLPRNTQCDYADCNSCGWPAW